ncbi:MAG: peptidoglycan-binding protein [Oscillospiraceae bacterium]|nr:peptidoglycan-binding protein [Oscillospiraceae bacterium]
MGKGYLILQVRSEDDALPIADAHITLKSPDGKALFEARTDANGDTEPLELTAPDKEHTLHEHDKGPTYSTWNVEVTKDGFLTAHIKNVQIIDTETAVLVVHMHPLVDEPDAPRDEEIDIPPMLPVLPPEAQQIPYQEDNVRQAVPAAFAPANPHHITHIAEDPNAADDPPDATEVQGVAREVFIPEYIRVHLGAPTNTSARNVRVPFIDYVKNVTSSEIYATWPRNALIANVHVIVTFALNRIFTEWYPSRNFNFDITNSTAFDQMYRPGAQIFNSISLVVDEYFNTYAHRRGFYNPFFTSFCNGTTARCNGLSQWGTVTLANRGLTPIQILRYYYPNDIMLTQTNNVRGVAVSFPGTALRVGSTGDAVRRMQLDLNRIRVNFPLIPQIANPNGTFGPDTEAAVRAFQRSFNLAQDGVIGRITWNEVTRVYTAVTRLAELDAEGRRYTIGENPPTVTLRRGSRGADVRQMQFLLNVISQFNNAVPPVIEDSVFDQRDENAVMDFQRAYGLPLDGVVGPTTWAKFYAVYRGIRANAPVPPVVTPPTPPVTPPPPPPTPGGRPFPGTLLRVGSRSDDVRQVQTWLNTVRNRVPGFPQLAVDGIFGPITQGAVIAFQRHFNLAPDGIVGPITWGELVRQTQTPQIPTRPFPGTLLRVGSRGDDVRQIQTWLNTVRPRVSGYPALTVDGIFGPITQGAVIAFQRHFNLAPDGIVGPITWGELVRQVNS